MPKNKDAGERYRVIDECLRNRYRKWTIESLIEKVSEKLDKSISPRTIQYDINQMKRPRPGGYDAPIIFKDGGYTYENQEYSIHNLPVNEDELSLLKQALSFLKNIKGLHLSDELEPVIKKLECRIETNYGREVQIMEFQTPVELKGIEYLGDLYKAILNKNVLKISYQKYNANTPKELIIHPYLLKEYNSRWFLFGYDEDFKKVSNLPLDRIKDIRVANKPYIENTFFDKGDYFKNIIGVSVPEGTEIESIELWPSPFRAPYVETKPIHLSQKVLSKNTKGMKIRLELIPNRELISLILSFGKDVKVLKPESLVKEIKENLKESLGR